MSKSKKSKEIVQVQEPKTALNTTAVDDIDVSEVETKPYIGVYNPESSKAMDVAACIENISKGQAYLYFDGEYFSMSGAYIQLERAHRYRGIFSTSKADKYKLLQYAKFSDIEFKDIRKPESKEDNRSKWSDAWIVQGVVLLDPKHDIDCPIPFFGTFKDARSKWCAQLISRIKNSKKSRFVSKNPKLAQINPMKRIVGILKSSFQPGKSGDYVQIDGTCMPATLELLGRHIHLDPEESDDKDMLGLHRRVSETYDRKLEWTLRHLPNEKGIIPATKQLAWSEEA